MILRFGAVDYEATVWVNGLLAGRHRGGYSPFAFEISDMVRDGENELLVRARDETRSPLQPSGKQSDRLDSYGCFYTRTTGIWQTVWLEAVPPAGLAGAQVQAQGSASAMLRVSAPGVPDGFLVRAGIRAEGREVVTAEGRIQHESACIPLDLGTGRLWSPDDPFLYAVELELREGDEILDRVQSYFGLRHIDTDGPAILLNGQPLFQRLVLDQGYHPDGGYTAPDDSALRRDIELSKAMGFNGARLHQKIFEPRFLYWADTLGYLVWGEYPSWGLDLSQPAALHRLLPEWLAAVERDFNHPSIVGWCPLNETAQESPRPVLAALYWATKAADGTRPVIDTSGYVHAITDVDDCHSYEQDPEAFAALFRDFALGGAPYRSSQFDAPHRGQPYFVSEYGGIWWNPGQREAKPWGYGERPRSEEEFLRRYRALTETLLFHPGMCGFCYTQLYDVEQEVNGLHTYARKPKFDPALIRATNRQTAAVERQGRRIVKRTAEACWGAGEETADGEEAEGQTPEGDRHG